MGSRVLETAIGLVLVYLLFSLLCSALNEWIARFFALRATGLRQGINELLSDGKESGIAVLFHSHPLIQVLKPDKTPMLRRIFPGSERADYPSYISPTTFALTVMDLAIVVSPPTAAEPGGIATLRTDLGNSLPAPLLPLLKGVQRDVDATRERLEEWFNDSMDRLSGWYKRRAQIIIVFIAAFVAIVLNIDSIQLTQRLFNDQALREALANQADVVVQGNGTTLDSAQINVNDLFRSVEGSGLPLGWTSSCHPTRSKLGGPCGFSLVKFVGLILTVIALAQGAPFWFETLNKLANLRQTGPPPDKG